MAQALQNQDQEDNEGEAKEFWISEEAVMKKHQNVSVVVSLFILVLGLALPPHAHAADKAMSNARRGKGYIIHLRNRKTVEVKNYWQKGDEIKYRRFGGILGVKRKDVAVIENKADGTTKQYNPYLTKEEIDRLQRRQNKAYQAKEEKAGKLWVWDALHGDIINKALGAKAYTRTVMMGYSSKYLVELGSSWFSLSDKLLYRAKHGNSTGERSEALRAHSSLMDQITKLNGVLAMRIRSRGLVR